MSSGARYLVGWGLSVAALATGGLVVFGMSALAFGLLAGAGAACAAGGLLAGGIERIRPRAGLADRPEAAARTSASTATAVTGAVIALVGLGVTGQALTWLGAAVLTGGASGVVAERRADRRRVHAATEEPPGPGAPA